MKINTLVLLCLLLLSAGAGVYADTVVLTWQAVGENGMEGTAAEYDLRYSTFEITEANFYDAKRVEYIQDPASTGTEERYSVGELELGQFYFFALKASNRAGLWSQMSNVEYGTPCSKGCDGDRGNINNDPTESVDISDLVYFKNYIFNYPYHPEPHCSMESDVNGDYVVDISDLTYLVNFLFKNGPPPTSCPW